MKNPMGNKAMRVIQITHNDLDGYGASAVARLAADVARTVHVTRYKDVVETFESIAAEVSALSEPAVILMTDIGIERDTAEALARWAGRLDSLGHRVVAIDHHASSIPELSAVATRDGTSFAAPGLSAVVDPSACATSLTYAHAGLYGAHGYSDPLCEELCRLVNAADLWLPDDPHFMRGMALNDSFWDMVGTYVPANHSAHEGFVTSILEDLARLSLDGASAAEIEDGLNAAKLRAVDAIAGPDPGRGTTARLRLAQVVARDREGFARISLHGHETLVTFAMDMGIFQRVSEIILQDESIGLVINAMRSGGLSLRSNEGQALLVAKRFRGGGHLNACGGDLGIGKCFSLKEAVEALERRQGSA